MPTGKNVGIRFLLQLFVLVLFFFFPVLSISPGSSSRHVIFSPGKPCPRELPWQVMIAVRLMYKQHFRLSIRNISRALFCSVVTDSAHVATRNLLLYNAFRNVCRVLFEGYCLRLNHILL